MMKFIVILAMTFDGDKNDNQNNLQLFCFIIIPKQVCHTMHL